MLQAADVTRNGLTSLRNDDSFSEIFVAAQKGVRDYRLTTIDLPRRKKIPKRLDDGSENAFQATSKDLNRVQFFQAIESAVMDLHERFHSSDLDQYNLLASALTTGNVNPSIIDEYPELSSRLPQELRFFQTKFRGSTIEDFRLIIKNMVPEVRAMFPQVERLLRLCLTSQASSCSAERSFSALRRLKSWLRSTMTQKRLNHVMVCHVHRNLLEKLDCREVAQTFVNRDSRQRIFGQF